MFIGVDRFALFMDYNLAKELQAAGFPGGTERLSESFDNNGNRSSWNGVYVPTLSKLIEQCGDQLFLSCSKNDCVALRYVNGVKHQGLGATPSEATARLWLSLNSFCPIDGQGA
jgi:hypothetical protein